MKRDFVHWGPPKAPEGPALLFLPAYACHQLSVGRSLGSHVLVLGQVYEDAEDAGGNVEGQGEAGPLLGPLRHLGGRPRGSLSPGRGVTLRPEQRVQGAYAAQDVDVQHLPLCVFVKSGEGGRAAPVALGDPRQQQSQAEAHTHAPHG